MSKIFYVTFIYVGSGIDIECPPEPNIETIFLLVISPKTQEYTRSEIGVNLSFLLFFRAFEGSGFWVFLLWEGITATVGATIEAWELQEPPIWNGEEAPFVRSSSPNRNLVRLEELASPIGVISLSNIVLPTLEELEKEKEETMGVPRSKRFCWDKENEEVEAPKKPSRVALNVTEKTFECNWECEKLS